MCQCRLFDLKSLCHKRSRTTPDTGAIRKRTPECSNATIKAEEGEIVGVLFGIIDRNRSDEIGILASALRTMVTNLRQRLCRQRMKLTPPFGQFRLRRVKTFRAWMM